MSQKLSHLQYADWLEQSLNKWLSVGPENLIKSFTDKGLSESAIQGILKDFSGNIRIQLIETPKLISLRGLVLHDVSISLNFQLTHYQNHELSEPQITGLCLETEISEKEMEHVKGATQILLWNILYTEQFSKIKEQLDKILLKGEQRETGIQLQKMIFILKNCGENQDLPPYAQSTTRLNRKENPPGVFESQPVNSFFNAKNIPSPIHTPPNMGLYKKSQNSLYDMIYVFSDGTQLNLHEVHFHPHAKTLHKDLLPSKIILSHLNPYIKTYERTEINRNKYAAIISILCKALKTRQQHRLQIFFGIETQSHIHLSPVNNISFVQTAHNALPQERQIGSQSKVNSSHWDVSLKMLRSQQKASTISFAQNIFKNKISFLNGVYDANSSELCFHPFASFIYKYLQIHTEVPCVPLLSPKWFEVDLTQFDAVSPVINRLQNISEDYHIDFRVSQDSTIISHDQIQPHYFFEENSCLPSLKINLKNETLWLSNFTGLQHLLLDILANGFKSFPGVKESKVRSRRKDTIRDMDMRVLKHRGLAFIFVSEFTQWLISKQDHTYTSEQISDQLAKQVLEPIFEKMAHIIFTSASAPSIPKKSSIRGFCSHFLTQSFTDGTVILIKQAFSSVNFLYKKHLYQIPKAHLVHLPFLQNWLHSIIDNTKGQCLQRQNKSFTPFIENPPNFSITNHPKSGHSYPLLREEEIHKWYLNPWKFYSSQDNVVCYYKGLELHFITADKFSGRLHLVQQDENESIIPNPQQDHIDWFALNPEFFLNGEEVSPDQVYRLLETSTLEHQGKFYVLNEHTDVPNLKALQWFWKRVNQNKSVKSSQKENSPYFLLPRHQILDLLALRAAGIPITGNQRWKQICQFYDNLDKPREALTLPESFKAQLKPYQQDGLHWILDLYNLGLGGILADDMGLGKTVQALSFFELLRSKKQLGHSLVAVPTSLTYNWLSESEKFTPELPIVRFSSKDKDQLAGFLDTHPDAVIIVTYGLLSENQEFFQKFQWNIHIYDEAQNLKNITAKRTCAARQVRSQFKLCLTGTPLENHYGELYSLMDLIVPGSLGDISEFKKTYVSSSTIQSSDIRHLKLQIKPLILRRTKEQILKDLPPKTEILLKIPFCEKQKRIYRDLALSWNKKVRDSINDLGESKTQIIMLTALLRLRQACSDPASIPNISYPDLPPKISTITDSIDEVIQNNDSALIFTQFLTTLQRLEKELTKKNIPVFILHGGLSQKKREQALKAFNGCETGAVFIMTLKTGGTGLNLTKASYVFHLEPWWNPAVENQATDRTHRIGQTKPITVYRYLMKESIEEKVEILKERKASKFSALFKETEGPQISQEDGSKGISKEDFDYLLGDPPS